MLTTKTQNDRQLYLQIQSRGFDGGRRTPLTAFDGQI
jgi:hypothetical protein